MQPLQALREARGLSQYDLAEIAAVTQPAIAHLSAGALCVRAQKPDLIASAVGVTPEEIAWNGPVFRLAEAHRLIGRALDGEGRGHGLRAMKLLWAWLAQTRRASVSETVIDGDGGGDDDVATE